MGVSTRKQKKLIAVGLSLAIPGWGQILLGKNIQAIAYQAILLAIVLGLCWSRKTLDSDLFLAMVVLVAGIHLLSGVCGYLGQTSDQSRIAIAPVVLFPVLFLAIGSTTYYHREEWLGIGLYQVPTKSMMPSIRPGDVVLVDTWAYRQASAEIGDIVLFTKPSMEHALLIKRVEKVSVNTAGRNRTRLFVTGDNSDFSNDSRHFGWVDAKLLRGRVQQILLTFTSRGIDLSRRGAILPRSPSLR